MRRFCFLFYLLAPSLFALALQAAETQTLLRASTDWNGGAFHYPAGEPEITAVQITLKPGEKLPFHCHPIPTMGFLKSGALTVETLDGARRTLHAGEPLVEVMNAWHRGINSSKKEEAVILVFYAGAKDIPTTHFPKHGGEKEACEDTRK